jgi:inosine-uridine nucleoside N-ribohydrolase
MINRLFLVLILTLETCLGGFAATPGKIPIILDTDIGSDIDDAFALALVIDSPELELLGVTTVSGNTNERARIAAKMLWEAGEKWRQVPVVAGVPRTPQDINQAAWAKDFTSPQIQKGSAVEFLRGQIHRHPGEITIIAIGELTNVAALIKADPKAAREIKRIALMGGSVARGYEPGSQPDAEWNIKSNPAAAQVVFSSGIPIIMAPLDVTAMLKLDAAGRERIFKQKTPVANSLEALYHLWNNKTPTLFDPMAVALVLDPTLCQTKNLALTVDDKGFTLIEQDKPANATVGLTTDPAKFFQFYLRRVGPE